MLTRYLSLLSYSPKAPPAASAPPARAAAQAAPETWKNIFAPGAGMQLASRLPAAGPGGAATVRSNFVLLGTIVSTRPGDSRAILWSDGMKLPKLVRINAQVEPGAVLASVTRDKAVITRGPGREQLDLLPVGSKNRGTAGPGTKEPSHASVPPGGRPSARQPAASAAAADNALRVERIGENSFALDETTLAQLSGNINQFMTNVRLVPYFEGNASAGYRIAAIRPGTAFEKLGFRGGDVLQQVNGVTLSTPEKMYTIFQNLKDEKMVTVDIIRQGKKSTLKYEIR